jgi:predicted Fe-Mo cluster-binding NifX family protein
MMKISIPVVEGKLSMHFGHCEKFAFIEVDDDKNIGEVQFEIPPPHEPGVLPKWLAEKGADLIIAGGMGMRAQQLFTANGIKVVVGAPAELPEVIVKAYLDGSLQTGDNLCDH